MVHPNYEGKGVAGSLIKFVEKLAKENGYTTIRLDVFSENTRAVNFYKKLGYRVSGKVNFRKGEFLCCEKIFHELRRDYTHALVHNLSCAFDLRRDINI